VDQNEFSEMLYSAVYIDNAADLIATTTITITNNKFLDGNSEDDGLGVKIIGKKKAPYFSPTIVMSGNEYKRNRAGKRYFH
jgi:hypothetical protein